MLKVLIRPLKIEDAQISYLWRNDPMVWKFTGSKPDREITLEMEEEWLKEVLKDSYSERFAITNEGKYIGNVQLTNLNNKDAQFHIFIGDKDSWGKGIATLATYQLLFYAKEILHLESVSLIVNRNNEAAVKSYIKNGFKIENEEGDSQFKMRVYLNDLHSPKVSVFLMVYNHEHYLRTCLDSIINQSVDFNVVINIGEDCSNDNSRAILKEYQYQYPGKFKLLLHEHNVGAMANQMSILKSCDGEYIAMCEGDDYWTDPEKLRKQVDYLEVNQDCNLVYHRSEVLDEESGKKELETLNNPDFTMKRDLNYLALNGNFMHTATVLYRNNFSLPQHLFKGVIGDYILWFLNGEKGKYGYIPDIMSVYRFWGGSVWGKKSLYFRLQSSIKMLCVLRDYTTDHGVKRNLDKKITTSIELLPLKSLNFKEKITFIIFILKVKPFYIFEFFKRGGRYIGMRK